jgi:hypothetical protein
MYRVKEKWEDEPGRDSHLSQDGIDGEDDWHDAFQERMSAAGWSLKHEEVCNNSKNRVDFLGYHNDLNTSYDVGEWVGFELKYSDRSEATRASSIVTQIDRKYRDATFLSSGEDVALWVVAPYVEASHTGSAEEMLISRHREIEAADILSAGGYCYLQSWHPTPHIMAVDSLTYSVNAFESFDPYIRSPGIPAFSGDADPWKACTYSEDQLMEEAEYARLNHSNGGDFHADWDEKHRINEKYHQVENE